MAVSIFAWLRKYLTVEPVVAMYMLGAYLQYPMLQQLVFLKVCLQAYNDTTLCNNGSALNKTESNFVEAKTSEFLLYSNIAGVVPSVLMLFLLGSWTDKFGRKTAMIMPSIGAVVSGANLIIQSVYIYLPLPYLFIGAVASGLAGGSGCIFMTTYSYIADVTDSATRTWRIGIVEAMTGLGITLGFFVGGFMLDSYGFVSVFILFLALHVAIIVYVVVWLKVTVQRESANKLNQQGSVQEHGKDSAGRKFRGLLNIENVKNWGRVICKPREKRGRIHIILLIIAFCVNVIATFGSDDLGFLFSRHQLGSQWSSTLYGIFGAVSGILVFLGLLVILPFVSRVLCDTKVGQLGTLSHAAGDLLFAFTTTVWMLFLQPVLAMLEGFAASSLRSILSKEVESTEKGALFSVVSSLEVLCQLVASLLYNKLYPATLSFFPGLSFVLMAGSMLIPVLTLQWLEMDRKHTRPYFTVQEAGGTHDEKQPLLNNK